MNSFQNLHHILLTISRLPMPEIVEDPRYEGLDEADRAKVGTNVNLNIFCYIYIIEFV